LFFSKNAVNEDPVNLIPIPEISQITTSKAQSTQTRKLESALSIPKRPVGRNMSNFLFSTFPSALKPNHYCPIDFMCSDPEFTGDILVPSNSELEYEKLLLIGRSIIPIVNGRGQVWIINANNYDIRLPPNNKIESFEPYKSDSNSDMMFQRLR
jgi:hypothetical protein